MHIFFQGNQALSLFLLALHTSFSTIPVHIGRQARRACLRPAFPGLHKNAAQEFLPLNSSALILRKGLAHNLFHKICEEVEKRPACFPAPRKAGLYQQAAGRVQPQRAVDSATAQGRALRGTAQILCDHWFGFANQVLGRFPPALRTLFSTVCVQSWCPAGLPGTQGALPKNRAQVIFPYESRLFCHPRSLAHNFVHKKCEETHARVNVGSWENRLPGLPNF